MAEVELNRLERTMKALTIGNVKRMNERRLQRELEGLQEYEEQFQIKVSGNAEEFPGWSTVDLKFAVDFVDGTGLRDSWLVRPQFTYGVYCEVGGPVGILACVMSWDVNDRDETKGCTLALGPVSTDVPRKFRAEVHASFQGFGAPTEGYGDVTSQDVE